MGLNIFFLQTEAQILQNSIDLIHCKHRWGCIKMFCSMFITKTKTCLSVESDCLYKTASLLDKNVFQHSNTRRLSNALITVPCLLDPATVLNILFSADHTKLL